MNSDTLTLCDKQQSSGPDFNTADKMTKKINKNQRPGKQNDQSASLESLDVQYRRARDLSRQIEQEPVVDNEKVNRIKAAINAGTYLIDANNIADKLMELEFELTKPLPSKE